MENPASWTAEVETMQRERRKRPSEPGVHNPTRKAIPPINNVATEKISSVIDRVRLTLQYFWDPNCCVYM